MRELFGRLIIGFVLLTSGFSALATVEPVPPLDVKEQQPEIARYVTRLIEEYHYSQPRLDKSLSSAVFDTFLDELDGSRMYFTARDIDRFNYLRYELHERARNGELEPVFDVFNLFRTRAAERIDYAISLLDTEPDFSVEESYRWDRSELPWPVSETEINEVWRQTVKHDALRIMLTDKTWTEAADVLRKRYERSYKRITQLTADDVFELFMNSVAHNVDPHSSYLSPRSSDEYRIQMSLSYEGIGASLELEDEMVKVANIIPGGPAQADGQLQPADRITAVGEGMDGELVDVIGWRLDDVVQIIRGPGGSQIRLQLLPAGAAPGSPEKVIVLTRDKVKLEEQAAKKELIEIPTDQGVFRIGVIAVPSFYQDFAAKSRGEPEYTSTSKDVLRLLEEFKAEGGIDGLVIDLRQNGGGHLSEATELSGLFIDRGPIVQLKETGGTINVLPDPSDAAAYSGPLAVLVNRYSASASEIFAAAIQDYERGVIIGQTTFGKGTVQNLFALERAGIPGQLTLTIGKYYRVTGESTQHRGVVPDIELPSGVDEEVVGESTRPTALPFDRIGPTDFRSLDSLDSEIDLLSNHQSERAAGDPDFRFLLSNIAATEELDAQKTVSLNYAKRVAERERLEKASLDRENARRAALGLEALTTVEELEGEEVEDVADPAAILLRQAARVVGEMIALEGDTVPRQRGLLVSGSAATPAATAQGPAESL